MNNGVIITITAAKIRLSGELSSKKRRIPMETALYFDTSQFS